MANLAQFNAIQNGANNNSLVSQLFGGKTAASTPGAIASSASVKNTSAPSSLFSGISLNPLSQGGNVATPSYAPLSSFPTLNTQSQTSTPPVIAGPKSPPINPSTPIKSVATGNDGSQTVTYHAPEKATAPVDNSGGTQNPNYNLQQMNGSQPVATQNSGSLQNTQQNTQQNQSQPQNSSSPVPTYPGILSTLLGQAQDTSAIDKANADLENLRKGYATSIGNIEQTPIPLEFQQGREQVLGRQFASEEAAAQSGLTNALTARGQNLSSLGQAAGLAQPQLGGYSQQYFNPLTGQSSGGGGSMNDAVSLAVQKVKNGTSYADAASSLSGYGQGGLDALNKALGSDFNVNASNASAGTQATGQQIKTAADSTNKALDTLSTAFDSLSGLQTGGIPATNGIAQWIGTALGSSALQKFKTNLADARSQLIGVLNSAGGTPTGNEATANQYLPDNMTVQQFKENVGTAENPGIVRKLIEQKVSSFTNSGQGSQTPNPKNNGSLNNTNSPASWL